MVSPKIVAAKKLAEAHLNAEPSLCQVFLLEPLGYDDDNEPVKLLEFVDDSLVNDIFAIGFDANTGVGVPYRSWVVEVPSSQMASIRKQGFVKVRGRELSIGEKLAERPEAA